MEKKRIEYQKVIEKFPEVKSIGGDDYNLQFKIDNEILLEVNYRKFPKKVKAYLVNAKHEKFKLNRVVSSLRDWDEVPPISIVELVEEILLLIDNLKSNQIRVEKDLIVGLADMCKQIHPRKFRGVLGVHKGIVSEYILPSRACTDSLKEYEIISQSCNLPFNFSYEGTFISRPSGSLSTNPKLSQVFQKRRFTMLLAHPYNLSDIKCFDSTGQVLEHIIID
jgi:hypothetical protein